MRTHVSVSMSHMFSTGVSLCFLGSGGGAGGWGLSVCLCVRQPGGHRALPLALTELGQRVYRREATRVQHAIRKRVSDGALMRITAWLACPQVCAPVCLQSSGSALVWQCWRALALAGSGPSAGQLSTSAPDQGCTFRAVAFRGGRARGTRPAGNGEPAARRAGCCVRTAMCASANPHQRTNHDRALCDRRKRAA